MTVKEKVLTDFRDALESGGLIVAKQVNPTEEPFDTALAPSNVNDQPLFLKKVELEDDVENDTTLSFITPEKWQKFITQNPFFENIKRQIEENNDKNQNT